MMVHKAQPTELSSTSRKQIVDALSMGVVDQVIIQSAWPWTMMGAMFGQCHAPRMLKTSFLDF